MGKITKHMKAEIEAMEKGDAFATESPVGDRGEPRPPASRANGRILLRLSRQEHARLVQEAAAEGVSLNHYLTEIVCRREGVGHSSRPASFRRSPTARRSHRRKR
ncbi:MAG: toxin-antitoxin system HicB family antitoxin [Planctomycetes bacterium]|nr:toxin-antitoxin system HicB family antitoxin [Planctomycetota bacterium]